MALAPVALCISIGWLDLLKYQRHKPSLLSYGSRGPSYVSGDARWRWRRLRRGDSAGGFAGRAIFPYFWFFRHCLYSTQLIVRVRLGIASCVFPAACVGHQFAVDVRSSDQLEHTDIGVHPRTLFFTTPWCPHHDTALNEEERTVQLGAGLTWTEVYCTHTPKGLNGIGVVGFIVYEGHSWKTPISEATIDTVTAKGSLNNYESSIMFHRKPLGKGGATRFVMAQPGRVPVTVVLFRVYDGLTPPGCLHKDLLNLPNSARGQPCEASSEFTVWRRPLAVTFFLVTGFDLRRRPGVTRKDKGALVCIRESGPASSHMGDHPCNRYTVPSSHLASLSGEKTGLSAYIHTYDSVRSPSAPIIKARMKDGQDWKDAAYEALWRGCT
ncbi:hypothetical protein EDB85DRAFT_1892480 [Lactarius pseudohatsudake]|nr:hypothetical protein EDB85DRAFT_1892480 [Lactarius pseudohatsudake]